MVSFYNPKEHSLIGGDINAFVRRLDEKLFVVRYNEIGSFCICRWLAGENDIFVDVINLGGSLANFTRKTADELRQQTFSPLSASMVTRKSAEAESDYLHWRQDFNDEQKELEAIKMRGEKL